MIGKRLQRLTKHSGKMEKHPPPMSSSFISQNKGRFGISKTVCRDNARVLKSVSPPESSTPSGVPSLASSFVYDSLPVEDAVQVCSCNADLANNQEEALGETRVGGGIGLHMSRNNLVTRCNACQAFWRHVNNDVSTAR